MVASDATAEVFWTAFRALSDEERGKFLRRLASDPQLLEDLIDIAVAQRRKDDPSRPIEDVLAELKTQQSTSLMTSNDRWKC